MITGRDIAVFYGVIAAVLFLLRLFPTSSLSRLAFTWLGPAPKPLEYKSHYFWRWALYGFVWFCQLAAVDLAVMQLLKLSPQLENSLVLQGFFFGFAMLSFVALGGALVAGTGALRAIMFGPNPRFGEVSVPHAL
jgi:hypothetical protein